jgi:hypothetical protein
LDDHTNIAEVQVTVDKTGAISRPVWVKRTGQKKWDDSVFAAIATTKTVYQAPPSNFPSPVVIRFDVAASGPVAD